MTVGKISLSFHYSTAWRRYLSLLPMVVFLLIASPAAARTASLVVDADSGEVLHAVNVDSRNYPASLTKMMTLYLLFDDIDSGKVHLGDSMPVSVHAATQQPSKLGLNPGQTVTVENALLGLVTKSANDAAVTVAEYLAGSESAFAQRMTRKAKELGMRQTQFRNASGLPNPDQKSTARDMATLARALIHNHSKYYHYFSTRQFTFNGEVMNTHNHLLEWYDGADGIKTGFIAASGFNLVASAKRDGRRLIGVVFGGDTATGRDRQMARLLDDAFARSPATPGVDLASLPDQADDDGGGSDAKAVIKAMAAGHGRRATAASYTKPRQVAARRQDESAGDADDDDWAIQVGMFSQPAEALKAAENAMAALGKLAEDGEARASRGKGHHAVYHARVIGLSEDAARQACHRLAKQHHACKVVDLGST